VSGRGAPGTAPDGVGRNAPAVDIRRNAPAEDIGRDAPAGDVGRDAPAGDAERDAPAGDVERDVPAGDIGRDAPASGVTLAAPASEVARGAPAADARRRPALVRLFERCAVVLARHAAGSAPPLLRLERGASLVRDERLEDVAALLEPLLGLAATRLHLPLPALRRARVRPKIRLRLGLAGSALAVRVRYFGAVPDDGSLCAACLHLGPRACALPALTGGDAHGARLAAGEVCLGLLLDEGPRRLRLVRVLAGRRQVAIPLPAVVRAVSEDALEQVPPRTRSLAESLGEDPVPASAGRPALLLLRRRGPALALRVEALLGHGIERVLPAGPLLALLPWLLGVLDAQGAPVLVVDPLALPGVASSLEPAA